MGDYVESTSIGLTEEVRVLIREAVEELEDHVGILVETQKAHINVLEIKNSRQFGIFALVVSIIISYAAVWESFVRDIIVNVKFPFGLSPDLNFALTAIALVPIFIIVVWGWRHRVVEN
jgi:hypothetical protein